MNPLLNGMNDRQAEAVQTTEGPLLIMAGAGSGKTRVLTHRIAYLIDEKMVNPWNILAITFTNKAAREMKERAYQLNPATQDCLIATFHSMCVRILRRDADHIGYNRNFTIVDPGEQRTLMKRILKSLNLDPKKWNERTILGTISNAKNDLIDEVAYAAQAGDMYTQIVAKCYEAYQKELRQSEAVDFDDLIMLTLRLFDQHPDVLTYYQQKFQYIHVDEYQDTNHAQYQLVKLLASRFKNICVVGDADQSIYGWRGANMENIMNFEQDYKKDGVKTVKLEQNYRSTGHILSAANSVIKNNQNRKAKNLWTDQGDGQKITYYQAQSGDDEAHYIISKIKKEVEDKKRSYKDFAILYRTNAQSRTVEEAFVKSNIPYQIVGGHKFYDRKEIKDIMAYLKLVANPADTMSMNRIINTPKRGIGAATVDKLLTFADENNYTALDAMEHVAESTISTRAAKKLNDFGIKLRDAIAYAQIHGVTGLTEKILEDFDYTEALRRENTIEAETRLENLDEFLTVTKRFDDHYEPEDDDSNPLSDFLAEVSLLSDQDDIDDDGNQVALMTLHAAKGLEFPVVFLIGMEDGLFPLQRAMMDDNELEEERRLAYVGITRAKQELFLTNAYSRMMYGRTQNNPASRFLDEIEPKDIQKEANEKLQNSFIQSHYQTAPFANRAERARAEVYTAKKATGAVGAEKKGWNVGDQVEHKAWGHGVVTKVSGSGEDMELDIAFNGKGIKRLLAAFAPIKKV